MVSLKRIFLGLILIFSSSVVFAIDISGSINIGGPVIELQNCTEGSSQYRPSSSCGTEEKKCCGSGFSSYWGEWGKICPDSSSCSYNQCWNGTKCEDKPTGGSCTCTNGTCSISYTCSSGSGWRESKNCTCKTGYGKSPYTGECVHSTCLNGCSSGSYSRQKRNSDQCECCMASCNLYHNGIGQCISGACNCMSYDYSLGWKTCCKSSSSIYTLPSDFSTCDQFGRAAFGQSGWRETTCPSCNTAW